MKIEIKQVSVGESGEYLVEFITPYGEGRGLWQGDAPIEGESYYIEFHIGGPLEWGRDIIPARQKSFSIALDGEKVVLRGTVEAISDVNDDNSLVLRVGDSLVLADSRGVPDVERGDFVTLVVEELRLFDINL